MLPAPPLASITRASIEAGAPSGLLRTFTKKRAFLVAPASKHERPYHESTRIHVAMRAARSRCATDRRPDDGPSRMGYYYCYYCYYYYYYYYYYLY